MTGFIFFRERTTVAACMTCTLQRQGASEGLERLLMGERGKQDLDQQLDTAVKGMASGAKQNLVVQPWTNKRPL